MDKFNLKYLFQQLPAALLYQPLLVLCFLFSTTATAQITDSLAFEDQFEIDTTSSDTSVIIRPKNKSALDQLIEYEANDSIILDLNNKRAFLYGKAKILYEDIKLKAEFIIVDFEAKSLYAKGRIHDSTGSYFGRPEFTDDGKVYEADTMIYNFETKKGLSMGVLTTEKDGYIHGEKVLRDSLENIFVKNAKFTTCNLPEPHFHIQANKIKLIPKKQIVTGPANLVIENINTPLVIPFGFFPIPEQKAHGVIFPTFGESPDRGFYFRGLGYYFPLGKYFDLQVTGDYYFRGSWGISANSNYYKRYKYRGNFGFSYNKNLIGEKEIPSSFTVSNDIRLNWTYKQDIKARPGSNFSANVNFVTSNYLRNNTVNYNDIITTTSTSSVNYSKSLFKNKLNMTVNSKIYQNLSTEDVNMTLPQLTANVPRQMLFKRAYVANPTLRSFIRNLGFSYSGNFKNEVTVKEQTLFTEQVLDSFNSGVSHNIPLSTSFKAFKYFTISPNFQLQDFWYFKSTEKIWDDINDTLLIDNNIAGFNRAHQFRFNMSMTTLIYGMVNLKKGPVKALRHVMRPSISFGWNPDFSEGEVNGFKEVQTDTHGTISTYSIFERGNLGRPGFGPQGSLNFRLGNNVEMKVRSKSDTTNGGIKKVKIIESFNVSTGYNFLADSFQLARINLNGNTTLFNKVSINFNSTMDPYAYDTTNGVEHRVNEFVVKRSNFAKLLNMNTARLSIATNLNPAALKRKTSDNIDETELDHINNNLDNYVDFNIPWSLRINYNLNYTGRNFSPNTVTQDLGLSGDINLTKNWKIGFQTGYDLSNKALALTSFDFYRNLHCWEMSFSWYPIIRQSFEFSIRVKSSTLQDLKLNRRRSWWDI